MEKEIPCLQQAAGSSFLGLAPQIITREQSLIISVKEDMYNSHLSFYGTIVKRNNTTIILSLIYRLGVLNIQLNN